MQFLVYSIISTSVLFLSYRVGLSRAFVISILSTIFILINQGKVFSYEILIYGLYLNALPIVTERFKKDFNRHKLLMRAKFKKIKDSYEELMRKDRYEIESNLEREKRLQQVLSLYEISKDSSACLTFDDIFNIFSSNLKKTFRFRVSRLLLLKRSKDIEAVYQIEIGRRVSKVAPCDFDRELVRITRETKKMISISPQKESQFTRRLAVIRDFETLISIPLMVEEKVAGVLYIENIPKMHFENFEILTRQFAMQFQKVILYNKVQELSITDSVTEISTRRYFLDRLSEEIRRSMCNKSNLSFLLLDIDHFKEKNDRFGRLVGDVILKEVARIIRSNLREIDIIGRYTGEEFTIALTGIGRDGAFQVAQRIRQGIERTVVKAYDEVVSTTVSIGVSVFPDDGVDTVALIESADKALYKAKESGRNKVC